MHHLAILSRYPVLRSGRVSHELVQPIAMQPLSAGQGAPISWDRPFLYALLDCGKDRRLWIVNLHLRAPIAARVPGGRKRGAWRSTALWAEGFFRAALAAGDRQTTGVPACDRNPGKKRWRILRAGNRRGIESHAAARIQSKPYHSDAAGPD